MARLADATLGALGVPVPSYDRSSMRASVVHLGLGAFARAHLCVYLDDLLARGHDDLAVLGVSLRHDDVPRALRPQDGLYTLGIIGGIIGDVIDPRVIGSVAGVVHAPSEPDIVRRALADPTTTMITATVTEKGYCWEPATRRLDRSHPDVLHDLEHPARPRSVLGHLVLAADDRRRDGAGPVTVLSLDNLPANGHTLAAVVRELAAERDPSLADWIGHHVAFPCSMVDRMVPATDDSFRESVAALLGVDDAWPVRAERFSQWVVEREWATPVPPLADVGVQFVDDVEPWETLKLRVLNGLHTVAAHYGLRHGLATVDAVTADPGGRALLGRVAAEIDEVLLPPAGVVTSAYVDTTLARFANPGLGHRCAQIAVDTSQKLPQRLLGTLAERLDRGLPSDGIVEALALWAWSALGRDHAGAPRKVDDPYAPTYAELAARHGDDAIGLVHALLGLDGIFGPLAGHAGLATAVSDRLAALMA